MDLLNLEVDGSLSNPHVLAAVAIWTVLLTVIAVAVVRRVVRSGRAALRLAGLAVAFLITPLAQHIIGNVSYWVHDPRIASVGFWGGPPVWIAPTVAFLAALVVWVRR